MFLAIVCGGSRGIGKRIVTEYLGMGYATLIVDLIEPEVEYNPVGKVREAGVADYLNADLTKWDALDSFLGLELVEKIEAIELVYSIGVRPTTTFLGETEEQYDHILNANVKGAFRTAQQILRYAEIAGVSSVAICNISSVLDDQVGQQSAAYHISKAGVSHLTRYIAVQSRELPFLVRSNAISPGFIVQERHHQNFNSDENTKWRSTAQASVPVGTLGEEADICSAVLWLNNSRNKFVNGVVLRVDGGSAYQETFSVLNQHSNAKSQS